MIRSRTIVTMLLVLVSLSSFAQNSKKLTLATTPWCPYTCDNSTDEFGLVGRQINTLLKGLGIELNIVSYPWSRAVRAAQLGNVDGLLTATP